MRPDGETSVRVACGGHVDAGPFPPHPPFRAVESAVGEYRFRSAIRFERRFMRDAAGHVRGTYRNFFPAHTRWEFAGLRLAEHA